MSSFKNKCLTSDQIKSLMICSCWWPLFLRSINVGHIHKLYISSPLPAKSMSWRKKSTRNNTTTSLREKIFFMYFFFFFFLDKYFAISHTVYVKNYIYVCKEKKYFQYSLCKNLTFFFFFVLNNKNSNKQVKQTNFSTVFKG